MWGYRGAAAGHKQPGEKRVAILGGSTTWGYGLNSGQDFPAQLEALIAADRAGGPVKVLNLGFNNEASYSFPYTLNDYAYLDYDVVVLYSGYNDLTGQNLRVFRHRSPIFLWTGYLPLLPSFTADKLSKWLSPRNDKIVFAPPGPGASETASALERQFGKLTDSRAENHLQPSARCPAEFQFYCDQIYTATSLAVQHGKRVLVVGEPYLSDRHMAQQNALDGMLLARFSGQPMVRYLNLGRTVDLRDKALCWDGMHLTEEGNRRIAAALRPAVLDLLRN